MRKDAHPVARQGAYLCKTFRFLLLPEGFPYRSSLFSLFFSGGIFRPSAAGPVPAAALSFECPAIFKAAFCRLLNFAFFYFLLSFLCPAGNSPAAAPLFCYPLTIRFLLSSLEVFSDRRQIFCRFLFGHKNHRLCRQRYPVKVFASSVE